MEAEVVYKQSILNKTIDTISQFFLKNLLMRRAIGHSTGPHPTSAFFYGWRLRDWRFVLKGRSEEMCRYFLKF